MRIPKREITIFTGVSGSGKSSLVFDTLENLSMAVVVDQKQHGSQNGDGVTA